MLQNPQWDFHSLIGLRDWIAKQPADQVYDWSKCHACVVGKYLIAHGHNPVNYSVWIVRTPGADAAVPHCFHDFDGHGGRRTTTMGEALQRLDAWIAKPV